MPPGQKIPSGAQPDKDLEGRAQASGWHVLRVLQISQALEKKMARGRQQGLPKCSPGSQPACLNLRTVSLRLWQWETPRHGKGLKEGVALAKTCGGLRGLPSTLSVRPFQEEGVAGQEAVCGRQRGEGRGGLVTQSFFLLPYFSIGPAHTPCRSPTGSALAKHSGSCKGGKMS